jgi:CBS domain-containing protein
MEELIGLACLNVGCLNMTMNMDHRPESSRMDDYIPEPLQDIAQKVRAGQRPSITLRTLLSWYGAERRGGWRNRKIQEALQTLRIKTEPTIESAYIDGPVAFLSTDEVTEPAPSGPAELPHETHPLTVPALEEEALKAELQIYADPTYRIGRLASANRVPVSVRPDISVVEATTIMLQNDFSQLPVMTSEREIKGMFSWKSIGQRLTLGKSCKIVREAIDPHYEVRSDESLFFAVALVAEHEFVLVRGSDKRICGIVTTTDLAIQFQQLGEPFLLLGEIENHVRSFLAGKFSREELDTLRDPGDASRPIEDVNDLGFGDYLRLLQEPSRWERIRLGLDRKCFIKELDEVRQIRNDVMHFDPDGIGENDLAALRKFVLFLQRLRTLNSEVRVQNFD